MKTPTKRDEILQAALELIAEHGFHGAPMAMIAEKAGVGAGTIYRYFETKDVLIRQLFDELKGNIMAALLAGHPTGRPSRERFFTCGKCCSGTWPPIRSISDTWNSITTPPTAWPSTGTGS